MIGTMDLDYGTHEANCRRKTERFRQFTWNGQILTFFKFHLGSCTIHQTLAKSLRVTDLKEFWARRGHTTPKIKVKVTHLQIFNFLLCIDLYILTFFKYHIGSCIMYQTLAKSFRVTDLKEFWVWRGHTTPKIKVKVTHLQIFFSVLIYLALHVH